MSSRIERAVREVSDLRSFYLRLQKNRREKQQGGGAGVEETAAPYYGKEIRRLLDELKEHREPESHDSERE